MRGEVAQIFAAHVKVRRPRRLLQSRMYKLPDKQRTSGAKHTDPVEGAWLRMITRRDGGKHCPR